MQKINVIQKLILIMIAHITVNSNSYRIAITRAKKVLKLLSKINQKTIHSEEAAIFSFYYSIRNFWKF